MLEIYPTRLEAPSRVPLPSVLLFDFIAMVCFHYSKCPIFLTEKKLERYQPTEEEHPEI